MERFIRIMGWLLRTGAILTMVFMFAYWWIYEYGGHHTVEYRTVTVVDDGGHARDCVVFTYGRGMAADCETD